VDFDATDPLLITDHIRQILKKKWEYNETVHQLLIDFKKTYDSVRKEVLRNNLMEFGIPIKLLRLMPIFLNEIYSGVRVGKYI